MGPSITSGGVAVTDVNRGVVYLGPGKVEVEDLEYPKFELEEQGHRPLQHGVILRVIATNICGSDQHMVRGRTTAPPGQTLGHEITGEVAEVGRDVEFIKQGDLVSVPFNIACGRCRNCKAGNTGVCENVNPARDGAAYGYVDMGGWKGGQANYVTVPYADWNLLKFPDRDQAMAKIRDLAMLSDIFPTGYHGAYTAGVGTGSTVYVAGAGPVGLACATSCQLLGAAVTIVGDMNPQRLQQARSFGCETIDLSQHDNISEQIEQIVGVPEVDAAVDCVGFEARGHGADGSQHEQPATVLNSLMTVTRSAGKLGIPGLYVTGDPGAATEDAKVGQLGIRIGLGWAKSHSFTTGQCPVMRYNRQLMMAILHDRAQIARNVGATVIPLEQAPQGYEDFDKGAARKYVLDPNQMIPAA
jgi:glutathione-independent formaldehyde dehydrogenase